MWVSYYATQISKNECLTPLGKMKTLIGLKKNKIHLSSYYPLYPETKTKYPTVCLKISKGAKLESKYKIK